MRALIAELDAFNSALYPAESNHFDPPEALAGARGIFLVVEQDGELVGCGAAKNCGGWAELKRMYLKPKARGGGIALAMLVKLLDWARAEKLPLARLETGNVSVGRAQALPARGFQGDPGVSALQARSVVDIHGARAQVGCAPAIWTHMPLELGQLKRQLKDLEERMSSLRGFL